MTLKIYNYLPTQNITPKVYKLKEEASADYEKTI